MEMKGRHSLIGDVRGRGCLLGVELVRDRATKELASEAAESVLYRCLDDGLSFKTTMGNVLTLTPPLVTTTAQMEAALVILEDAISETERTIGAS
jgi:4-aminobutyrate aminotransferase